MPVGVAVVAKRERPVLLEVVGVPRPVVAVCLLDEFLENVQDSSPVLPDDQPRREDDRVVEVVPIGSQPGNTAEWRTLYPLA